MSRGGDDVTTVVELREVSQDMLKMDDVKRDKTHVASSGQHMNKHDQWSIVVLIVLCKLPQASASFSFADFQGEGSSCLCFLFSFYGVGLNFLLPFSLSPLHVCCCGILTDMVQGIPLGLTFGSLPFLLKERASFSEMGLFSLASYPYSLKLFWSPIVDSIYAKGS